jgi:hypothetical protein
MKGRVRPKASTSPNLCPGPRLPLRFGYALQRSPVTPLKQFVTPLHRFRRRTIGYLQAGDEAFSAGDNAKDTRSIPAVDSHELGRAPRSWVAFASERVAEGTEDTPTGPAQPAAPLNIPTSHNISSRADGENKDRLSRKINLSICKP